MCCGDDAGRGWTHQCYPVGAAPMGVLLPLDTRETSEHTVGAQGHIKVKIPASAPTAKVSVWTSSDSPRKELLGSDGDRRLSLLVLRRSPIIQLALQVIEHKRLCCKY